jgi:hypothetical protein
MNRIALPITLAAASLALFAGPAAASTTLGQVAPAPNPAGGCTTCSSIQISTAAGSPSYVVPPGGGIVTSWTFHAIGQAGTAQMRLLQPLPGNQYKLVAQSPVRTFALNELATTALHIPVQGGEHLGIAVNGPSPSFVTSVDGDIVGGAPFGLALGDSYGLQTTFGQYHANVAVTFEPDADHDGFGDDTEDGCPSDPASQAACRPKAVAPAAIDTRAPSLIVDAPAKESVKRGRLTVFVTSSEAGTARVSAGMTSTKTAALKANTRTKLTLRIPRKQLRAVRKSLHRHGRVRARIAVVVKDNAGNAGTAAVRVRLAA